MSLTAEYVHTNLIAKDWQALASFYQQLFGCIPVPPERDLSGEELEAGTGLQGAHLLGVHLRLPGYGENGPTLEIFSYSALEVRPKTAVNRPGFGHIAFSVDDVAVAQKAVLEAGGQAVGEIVTMQIATGAEVTWCYVTDIEGNIIELQSWSKQRNHHFVYDNSGCPDIGTHSTLGNSPNPRLSSEFPCSLGLFD
jgi:predicted enzyme related to lactoylglutathione lyase